MRLRIEEGGKYQAFLKLTLENDLGRLSFVEIKEIQEFANQIKNKAFFLFLFESVSETSVNLNNAISLQLLQQHSGYILAKVTRESLLLQRRQ